MIVIQKSSARWNRAFIRRYAAALADPAATRESIAVEFGYGTVRELVAAHDCMVRARVRLPPLPPATAGECDPGPPPRPKQEAEPPAPVPPVEAAEPAPPSSRLPPVPPVRLPEGDAYRTATRWLMEWGHTITWQRFGKTDVPVIDGRLSNVAYLCALWHEERQRRFGRSAPPRSGLRQGSTP